MFKTMEMAGLKDKERLESSHTIAVTQAQAMVGKCTWVTLYRIRVIDFEANFSRSKIEKVLSIILSNFSRIKD